MGTIRIISTKKIEVQKELAYVDKTPELTGTGAMVMSSGDLMRVNTLKPVTYQFLVGNNIVPEPITFIDPITRKEVKESILTWPGVKHLVDAGVFDVYTDGERISLDEKVKPEKTEKTKKTPSLTEIAEK